MLTAAVLLLLLSWLLILLYALLLISGTRPIFRQTRIGKSDQPIIIYKFRTFSSDTPGSGVSLLGNLLRKSSLDELPQLFNIIKGEMSFVGPRPLLPEYLPLYTANQRRRHLVKPGITGWAQVKGRNALSWTEQFELDVWYVENRSIGLDLRILVLTAFRLLKPGLSEVQIRQPFNGKN